MDQILTNPVTPHSTDPPLTRAGTVSQAPTMQRPEVFRGPWSEARAVATTRDEPLFIPVSAFADDRGWSIMNLMSGAMSAEGQINFSWQYPGVIKAWHRHARQTDFWTCVGGHLKAGVYRESDHVGWSVVIGEHRPGVLVIPPGLWHGATPVGMQQAGLLYYVTHAYDPENPDEQRRAWDSVPGFPWGPQHG